MVYAICSVMELKLILISQNKNGMHIAIFSATAISGVMIFYYDKLMMFQSLCHSITATVKSNDSQVQQQSCATDMTSQQFDAYSTHRILLRES